MERFFLEAVPVLLKAEFCSYWYLSVPSKETSCLEVALYYSVFVLSFFWQLNMQENRIVKCRKTCISHTISWINLFFLS